MSTLYKEPYKETPIVTEDGRAVGRILSYTTAVSTPIHDTENPPYRDLTVITIAVDNRIPVAGTSLQNAEDMPNPTVGAKLAFRRAMELLKREYPKDYKRWYKALWISFLRMYGLPVDAHLLEQSLPCTTVSKLVAAFQKIGFSISK